MKKYNKNKIEKLVASEKWDINAIDIVGVDIFMSLNQEEAESLKALTPFDWEFLIKARNGEIEY
jgi:hypothetical protein